MTPAQRRERLARELWPDYDRRAAIGRKLWATCSILAGLAGMEFAYTPGGFLYGLALIGVAAVCARAAMQ